jgi:RNA polymerase sigma-70 factor (ECF subfamily)
MSAFDELFTRYHAHIYGYLLGLVGNAEQARGLTQDTFLKAYKVLSRTPDLAPPIWLYRIATDVALDALHGRRRPAPFPFAPGNDRQWVAVGAGMASACAEHAAMPTVLVRLTPRQRACLLLRARGGFSIDDIVHILGISPGAVKVTLRRVKEQCRTEASAAPVRQPSR